MSVPTARVLQGHALPRLAELPDESVHCCVTSPPYWALRAYGTEPQIWGGNPLCEHRWTDHLQPAANGIVHAGGMSGETLSGSSATRKPKLSAFCSECGAWRGELGLEPTPELYVEHIVQVFREVRRVLTKDGTLFVNLGDSYAGSWGAQSRGNKNGEESSTLEGSSMLSARQIEAHPKTTLTGSLKRTPGLKPKDLVGIPWMVAFALRADGWYLRMDIIWSKPNPMPESVTDRPTKAHEYLFLFSKSRQYYYDAAAIAEPCLDEEYRTVGKYNRAPDAMIGAQGAGAYRTGLHKQSGGRETRNKRSVWTITTAPYPDAHFATFPPELPRICISAGCPPGGVVLDPFGGSGTTGAEALKLGCSAVLIELQADYIPLIEKRLAAVTPGFTFEEAPVV